MTSTLAPVSSHYKGDRGNDYFAQQNMAGDLGGRLSARSYLSFVRPGARVLDFGCAGGWVLKNLPGVERHGVEVNVAAHDQARANGVAVTETIEEQDGVFDLVMSNHCLEHVPYPIAALTKLRDKLKPDGKLVLVLPLDDWRRQRDIAPECDNHLHTWTPRLAANMLREAGFVPRAIAVSAYAWPPKHDLLHRVLPGWAFDMTCRIFARLVHRRELVAVASRG